MVALRFSQIFAAVLTFTTVVAVPIHGFRHTHSRAVEAYKRGGSSGKVSMGYFANWDIYQTNFQPTDLVTDQLTHIMYAFAQVDGTGTIQLSDLYADQQKHYPTDSWDDTGNNLYGNFKQLYLLKLKQRNLKVILSVGGWTYSQAGQFNFVTDASLRANFVSSAVKLIEDNGLDGLDIDFEYPTAENSKAFGTLLQELRTAFDQHAESKGDTVPYQITAAISAGPTNYENYDMAAMTKYLSYWDLMAYDYAGSWSPVSADHANLYHGVTGINTDTAIDWFLSNGVSPSQMTVGIPLYGRSFELTKGIYKPFNGVGSTGIYNYNQLPRSGATVTENKTSVAAYSFNHATQELVSYDTPNTASWKAEYVNSKGLGGAMFWELSGDGTGSKSIVSAVGNTLGDLDQTQNHINYPGSQFDNIKNNMGNSATSSDGGSISISSVGSTGGVTTKTCGGVAAWSSTAIYVGGKEASYKNEKWQAKWWTQGDVPGGEADVWVKKGKC